MNIDEKIKQELTAEAKEVDALLVQREGIFSMLLHAFKGALGGWMILISVVVLFVSALMAWAGYQFFFTSLSIEDKLHWGMILLICLITQVAMKMWTFMEMNRMSVLRELKRLEITLSQKG